MSVVADRCEAQVAAALDAVQLRPPGAFLWFGRRETAADEGLVQRLAGRLYDDFFRTGAPRPRGRGPAPAADDGGELLRALSQANGGRGAWQEGWRIAAVEADGALLVVGPDGLALVAPAGEVRCEGDAATGAVVAVLQPKELRGLSPGFYVALGDAGRPAAEDRVALFWNVAAAGAVTLVARLTYALNGAGLPFCLELPADPARYGRGDAPVLCLARADVGAALVLCKPLLRALGGSLTGDVPAFALPLARGLAIVELPSGGERFGEHRCRLLAEAIVAAGEAGAAGPEERLAAVRARFAGAGLSLAAAHLQPGSTHAYDRP